MRRRMNLGAWLAVAAACLGAASLGTAGARAADTKTYLLHPERTAGQLTRAKATLEVQGKLKLTRNGKEVVTPLDVQGTVSYDEKLLDAYNVPRAPRRMIRYYDPLEAQVVINKKVSPQVKLRDDQRWVVASSADLKTTLFAPKSPLSREELEAISLPGDTAAIDNLLPDEPVAVGAVWTHEAGVMAQLLGLDDVSETDAKSTLKSVEGSAVRMEIAGKVRGVVQGATTEINVTGRYQYELDRKQVTWVALLIKENRARGFIGPALESTSRLVLHVTPLAQSEPLSDAKLAGLSLEVKPQVQTLYYGASTPDCRFELLHDRRWHVINDDPRLLGLRLMEGSELVAQMNLTPLPATAPGRTRSLEEFQADVQKALGKSFSQFSRVQQSSNRSEYRVYRIEAVGTVNELSIQWVYYYVADKSGRNLAIVFTLETKYADQFASIDQTLVDSIQLSEPKPNTTAQQPAPTKR